MRSASKFTPSALEIGFPTITGSISALAKTRRSIIAATCGITEAVSAPTSVRTRQVLARTQPRPRISTRVRASCCAPDVRHRLIVAASKMRECDGGANSASPRPNQAAIRTDHFAADDARFAARSQTATRRTVDRMVNTRQYAQRASSRVQNHARSPPAHARSLPAPRASTTTPCPPSPRHARCNV